MHIRLLGPVAVVASGRVLDVGPPQRCAALAALAVDARRQVATETLIDRVWGENPPEGARRALHAHVTRIRRTLEQAGADEEPVAVLRRSGGYVLDVDPDRVDLHRFRRLCGLARDPERTAAGRAALLGEALGLWQGEPLAGVAGEWAARTRQSWRQQHLDAVLAWARAEMCGNPAAVIGPLSDLVGTHPFLEPLVAVLMRALYLAGDAARALELYSATRQRLVAELGAEPGPELRRVHHGVLRGDLDPYDAADPGAPRPASGQPAAGQPASGQPAAAGPAAAGVPAQLPRDIRLFTGRGEELARLDAELPGVGGRPAEMVLVALSGTAGVGKTTLAVHWAHRVRDRFPDGQLYVNLRGFDPAGQVMTAGDALRGFLDALGVPPQRMPVTLDGTAALYRSLLSGRRMLVVLDNARSADQVRPLLPAAPGCLVLVTSRNHLSSLVAVDGAQPLMLDLLTRAEARRLLTRRLGADRTAGEPTAVEEIITRCARLPLALAIVAARAATHPHLSLALLAKELSEATDRLDALDGDDASTDVRAVFSWSCQALSPHAARLFRLLGLHPGPDISLPAAASLAGESPVPVRVALAELARAHLLAEHVPARYACHDLLRIYAAEQARSFDAGEQRQAATLRVLDHYLHTAHAGALLLSPLRKPLALPEPQPGVTPETLADRDGATAWFGTEHQVLLAAIGTAAAGGLDAHAWQLASTLSDFLERGGYWQGLLAANTVGVAAARRLGDFSAGAQAHNNLALVYARRGEFDQAYAEIQQGLALCQRAGDSAGQGTGHLHAAMVWYRQGRHAEGLEHSRRALELFRASGQRLGQAEALNGIGWFLAMQGDHEHALPYCEEALALLLELGDRDGAGLTLDSLGYIHQALGDHAEAIACYRQAAELLREVGNRVCEAGALLNIGDCHDACGQLEDARTAWQHAMALYGDVGNFDMQEKLRAKLQHATAPASIAHAPGGPAGRDVEPP